MTGGLEDFSRFVRRWGPVVIWLLLMLGISTDVGSMQTSQRLLNPVLLWFNPHLTVPELYHLNVVARKILHLTEFAVLAMLVWRTRNLIASPWPGSGAGRLVAMTLGICAALAIATELIQYCSRYRGASGWDVLINLTGSVLGLLILAAVKKLRGRTSARPLVLVAAGIDLEHAEDSAVLTELWETVAETGASVVIVIGPVGPLERADECLALLKETAAPARVILQGGGPEWTAATERAGLTALDDRDAECEGMKISAGTDGVFLKPPAPAPAVHLSAGSGGGAGDGLRHLALESCRGVLRFALYDVATGELSGPFAPAG